MILSVISVLLKQYLFVLIPEKLRRRDIVRFLQPIEYLCGCFPVSRSAFRVQRGKYLRHTDHAYPRLVAKSQCASTNC